MSHSGVKRWALLHEPKAASLVLESGSPSKKEVSMGEQVAFGRAMVGEPSEPPSGDGGVVEKCKSNSPHCVRKKKGLGVVGESRSHPRRSARISERRFQASTYPCITAGLSVASLSDRDIMNCNSRMVARSNIVESPELWEIGKKIGVWCREDEQEVIKNYDGMEVRDSEMASGHKEGNDNSVL